jgi:glycosyltransferase involved in cell wall biosynthesis
MKILMAAPVPKSREGGTAATVYNVAEELRRRGHVVTCLFLEDLLPKPVAFPRFTELYFAFRLARLILKKPYQYDVVNIHTHVGFIYGFLRRFFHLRRTPLYVLTLQGSLERFVYLMSREEKKDRAGHFHWKNRAWHHLYHMQLYHCSIRTADHSTVVNRELSSVLQLRHKCEPGRVWYVPNGVEERFFVSRNYAGKYLLRLLFVGTWLDRKGIYYLRDAFMRLAQDNPALQLTVAGCAAVEQTVKPFFPETVRGRVTVIPFVQTSDMPALYARHDIFVFPSLMEGMPLSLLEAMAAGMPVVTTESCGMADVVEDQHNGLLVKPADSLSLSFAVQSLLDSPALRERLGSAAQDTMRRYTWDRIAAQMEKVFTLAVSEQKQK